MVSSRPITSLCLATCTVVAAAATPLNFPSIPNLALSDCGELNIIFTGLPPFHPLVTAQHFNSSLVNAALHADFDNLLKAGYNTRVVLMGPEVNISTLANQIQDTEWTGTGVGYGVRGSSLQNVTARFTDIIALYREMAPSAPTLFDYSPDTALWAVQRRFPLSNNCTASPGKDLGFETFCDICTQ